MILHSRSIARETALSPKIAVNSLGTHRLYEFLDAGRLRAREGKGVEPRSRIQDCINIVDIFQLRRESMKTAAAKTRDGSLVDMKNKTTTPELLR